MALIADSQIFYINSNNRLTGNSSDFTALMHFDSSKEFNRCCVLQCSIPVSYFLIEATQNTFNLIEGIHNIIVSIPIGNYNRRSFASTLSSILTSASLSGWTYLVSYPQVATMVDTGYYTYSVSGNLTQPSFIFGSYCYSEMGFDINSTNVFIANTLISTNVINLTAQNQLFLHSDMCSNKNDDILQEIYSSGTIPYSNILFQNIDVEGYSKDFITNNKNSFRFYLTDTLGNPINLNGANMAITVLLYKRQQTWTLLNGFIKWLFLELPKVLDQNSKIA